MKIITNPVESSADKKEREQGKPRVTNKTCGHQEEEEDMRHAPFIDKGGSEMG